jgi:hypothetical protein
MSVFSCLRRAAALLVLSLAAALPAAQAAHGRAHAAERVAYERLAYERLAYEQLGSRLGQHIVVHTRIGSRRAGTLVRYSQAALRLRLAPRDGGVDLDIPSSSVRDIEIAHEPDTSAGADSAQKN